MSAIGRWRVVGQSVPGASHVRAAMPNQDAWRCLPASAEGAQLIVAVSDGHGSARSFRSHIGSARAVDTAAWVLQDLLDGQPDPLNLSAIKRTAEERLPHEIVRHWEETIAQDLAERPFTAEELELVAQKQSPKSVAEIEANPRLAYGATLLVVLVTPSFILYLQLGDGDILTVSENGEVARPMPEDKRLFANQTTSLCIPDAWRDFRIRFQTLTGELPALILLSTDGYANSFVNEEAFIKVGSDIWDILRNEGLDVVKANLEGWLNQASTAGSGDDITLALLCRTELLPTPEQLAARQLAADEAAFAAASAAASAVASAAQAALALAEPEESAEEAPSAPAAETPSGAQKLWYDDSAAQASD
ncbi:MAG: protein phosphatase 2C domain-containing protein [Anaerolineae bacterium]|nr:protein phosphatase 2C domain-containing protein [Anaerolineae bacterium]